MAVTGKVSWFEIASADPAASRSFYESLFGWAAQGDPEVYLMFPHAEGGIPGGLMPSRGGPSYACFGVEVDDVDEAHRQAVELGAESVVAPMDNPGGVRSAYLRDPDGSIFSVYRFTGAAG